MAAGVVLHVAWQHRPKWLRRKVPKQARLPPPPRKALPTFSAKAEPVAPTSQPHAHVPAPAPPTPAAPPLPSAETASPATRPRSQSAQSAPTYTAAAAAAATAFHRQPAYVPTDSASHKEGALVSVPSPARPIPVPCCGSTTTAGVAPPPPPPTTMILIVGGDVYAPERLGRREVFIAGGSIAGILEPEDALVAALTKAARCVRPDATCQRTRG